MTRIPLRLMVIIAIVLAVLGGRAISAQDKYSREHAPGIPEPGDASALVSAESPPAPSRHAIVPDLPAAAPIPDPQGPPAAEQPAEALAVNSPEPSAPVSKAPDLPVEAATPELHPQVAEKPAEAVNTPEHHLDASPPNYTALPPVTTAPPSVDVTALPNDAEIVPKPVRKPVIQNPVGKPVIQKPATAPPSRKRAQIGILERRRMLREGLMSPGFLPPR
jgi:hypothetical protein